MPTLERLSVIWTEIVNRYRLRFDWEYSFNLDSQSHVAAISGKCPHGNSYETHSLNFTDELQERQVIARIENAILTLNALCKEGCPTNGSD